MLISSHHPEEPRAEATGAGPNLVAVNRSQENER